MNVLINNAGFGSAGDFKQSSLEENCDIIDLNVNAAVRLTHLLLPYLVNRITTSAATQSDRPMRPKGSRILFVGSIASSAPGPRAAIYTASKAFLNSFALSLRREVIGDGVIVSIAKPGPVRSKFSQRAGATDRVVFRMPFISMSSYQAAKQIYLGMMQGRDVIVPGVLNKIYSFLLVRLLPMPCTADLVKLAWSPMPRLKLGGSISSFGELLRGRPISGKMESQDFEREDKLPSFEEGYSDEQDDDRSQSTGDPALERESPDNRVQYSDSDSVDDGDCYY